MAFEHDQCYANLCVLSADSSTSTENYRFATPEDGNPPPDYCESSAMSGDALTRTTIEYNRIAPPAKSVTCLATDADVAFTFLFIFSENAVFTFEIWSGAYIDPLAILQSLTDVPTQDPTNITDDTNSTPTATIGDIDISACRGLDAATNAQCTTLVSPAPSGPPPVDLSMCSGLSTAASH